MNNHITGQTTIQSEGRQPLVSIIIAVFNAAEELEKTLRHLSIQHCQDFEIIIMDGGSTDDTLKVANQYLKPRTRIYSEIDKGVYDAMNKGTEVANGKWLYFLNAGDLLLADLNMVIPYLISGVHFVYGESYWPKHNILYNGRYTKWKLLIKNICHQAIFYNAEIFTELSYDLNYKYKADYYLNLNVLYNKKYIINYCPILIAYYDDWGGLSKENVDLEFERTLPGWIKKNTPFHYYLAFIGYSKFMKLGRKIKRRIGY